MNKHRSTKHLIVLVVISLLGNVFSIHAQNTMASDTLVMIPDTSIIDSIAPDSALIVVDSSMIDVNSTQIVIDSAMIDVDSTQIADDSSRLVVDSMSVSYFQSSFDNLKFGKLYPFDTTITYFQQFDPLTHHNKLYSTLSNIGLAANNQVFSPTLSIGYSTQIESFKNYLFTNPDVKYFELMRPFTEIFYVMGSKKEQNLGVSFAREIFEGFTFGLDFTLNSSPGFYKNSKSNDSRVYFTARYQTPNKRYGVLANYLHNKIDVQENGGIQYDSVFELNLETDRRVIPVNLNNATNLLKKSGFFVDQYFNLLKPLSKKGNQIRKIDVGHISYSFLYEQNKLIYQDADTLSNFYIGYLTPLDSTSTLDSIYQQKISNTFKWSSIGYQDTPEEKHFYLFFGITQNHLIQSYAYDSVNNTYNQLVPFAGMGINIGKSFYLNVDAQLAMGDYNGGDYRLSGKLNQYLGRKDKNVGEFSASLDLMSKTPEWYFNKYNSNHYRWNNHLKKEQYSILSAKYTYRDISVGGTLNSIENYTYFNDSMQPSQIEKGESILQLYIEGSLPWKSVGLNTRIVYQETSQPNQIRLPKLTGTIDLYFQHTIFKQAATVKTGFQVTYFTSYYADASMPELRVFYLQNEQKIGNYPYVDFYLTLVVKRARMFFKWAHLNGYLNDNKYYAAPHYPSRDARLYFGVSWRFHD